MKLSERNKILNTVSEVLFQCQSLIHSLSNVDVFDDSSQMFQSTKSTSSSFVVAISPKPNKEHAIYATHQQQPRQAPAPQLVCRQVPKEVYNQVPETSYVSMTRKECRDVPDEACVNTQERTCQFSQRPVQETFHEESCSTAQSCSTRYENKCEPVAEKKCTTNTVAECKVERQCDTVQDEIYEDIHEPYPESDIHEPDPEVDSIEIDPEVELQENMMEDGEKKDVINAAARINPKDVIFKAINFITTTMSDNIYNRRWKEEHVNLVFGYLSSVCYNSVTIFADIPDEVPLPVSMPKVQYPSVDWSQVNVRNLANIPTPNTLPIHGCSPDSSHYDKTKEMGYHGWESRPSKFEQPYPFGHLPGYLTDQGPIALSNDVIFGHVWSVPDHKWILHSAVQREDIQRRPRGRRQERK